MALVHNFSIALSSTTFPRFPPTLSSCWDRHFSAATQTLALVLRAMDLEGSEHVQDVPPGIRLWVAQRMSRTLFSTLVAEVGCTTASVWGHTLHRRLLLTTEHMWPWLQVPSNENAPCADHFHKSASL